MNLALVVLLYFLAVMRITRLINFDTIMDWLHNRVGNRWGPGSWQAEFVVCPWCVGMWVGLTTAWAPLLFAPRQPVANMIVLYVLLALSASMMTGLFAFHTSEDTAFDEEDEQGNRLP